MPLSSLSTHFYDLPIVYKLIYKSLYFINLQINNLRKIEMKFIMLKVISEPLSSSNRIMILNLFPQRRKINNFWMREVSLFYIPRFVENYLRLCYSSFQVLTQLPGVACCIEQKKKTRKSSGNVINLLWDSFNFTKSIFKRSS